MTHTSKNIFYTDITQEVIRNNGNLYEKKYTAPVIIKDCTIAKLKISESIFEKGLIISNAQVKDLVFEDSEIIGLNDVKTDGASTPEKLNVNFSVKNCTIGNLKSNIMNYCILDLAESTIESLSGEPCKETNLSGAKIKEISNDLHNSLSYSIAQMYLNRNVNISFTIGEGEECDTSCPETINNIDNKILREQIYNNIDIIKAPKRFDELALAASKSSINYNNIQTLQRLIAPFDLGMTSYIDHSDESSMSEKTYKSDEQYSCFTGMDGISFQSLVSDSSSSSASSSLEGMLVNTRNREN